MKNPSVFALFSLIVLSGCATSTTTGSGPTAAGPRIAGSYAGKWSGSDGVSGDVRFTLQQAGGGAWDAQVALTYQGDAIPTTLQSVKVDGTKMETVYTIGNEGRLSTVKMTGEFSGTSLAGDYEVMSSKGKVAATGKWTAGRTD